MPLPLGTSRRCIIAGHFSACLAASGAGLAASTTFRVEVTVSQPARIESKAVPSSVRAPLQHAARSASPTATRLTINAPGAELRLHFTAVHKSVRHVEVRGTGLPVTPVREGGRASTVLGDARYELEIDYSVAYEGDLAAGVGPAPVQATVEIVF